MHGDPEPSDTENPRDSVLAIYNKALPQVFGYLLPRCGSVDIAEDLTAETFLAAVEATRGPKPGGENVSVPWLIGVARHKLVDHWRRAEREGRLIAAVGLGEREEDPWPAQLDAASAHTALAQLNGFQRAALVLRHVDGLPVGEVAACLGRSVQATKNLLARSRAALRRAYQEMEADPDA